MWKAAINVKKVDKIFKNLDGAKSSGIDQNSGKDCALVIAIHLANIINLSMRLDTFLSKCKIAKIKLKAGAKHYRITSLLPSISRLIEKSNSRSNKALSLKNVDLSIKP